jgi:hypothetical protein
MNEQALIILRCFLWYYKCRPWPANLFSVDVTNKNIFVVYIQHVTSEIYLIVHERKYIDWLVFNANFSTISSISWRQQILLLDWKENTRIILKIFINRHTWPVLDNCIWFSLKMYGLFYFYLETFCDVLVYPYFELPKLGISGWNVVWP